MPTAEASGAQVNCLNGKVVGPPSISRQRLPKAMKVGRLIGSQWGPGGALCENYKVLFDLSEFFCWLMLFFGSFSSIFLEFNSVLM